MAVASAWSYAQQNSIRSAATGAGFSWSEADCITRYLTTRYAPSDNIGQYAVNAAADSCS